VEYLPGFLLRLVEVTGVCCILGSIETMIIPRFVEWLLIWWLKELWKK
jgi:hypothetical protein